MLSGTLSQGEEAEPLDALIREFTRIVSEPWPFLIESCMSMGDTTLFRDNDIKDK